MKKVLAILLAMAMLFTVASVSVSAASHKHEFVDYVSNNDATCLKDGTETAPCIYDGCGITHKRTDVGSKLDYHTPNDAILCQEAQTCIYCGIEVEAKTDCKFIYYVADNNASCKADGTKTAPCIYGCGATDTAVEAGTKLDHTPGATATCMAPQTCTECGEELKPVRKCKFGTYVSNNDATCTADGTKTALCKFGCGATNTVTDEGSMLAHTPSDAPLCQEAQICTVCGVELKAIRDCKFVKFVSDDNATCTTDGTKTAYCKFGCGLSITMEDIGSSLPHTPNNEGATCQENQICTECGAELDTIKEHTFVEYVYDDNATCYTDATETAYCIYDCGVADVVVVEGTQLTHTDDDGNKECDHCGIDYCGVCGEVHETFVSDMICLLKGVIKLVVSFFKEVF